MSHENFGNPSEIDARFREMMRQEWHNNEPRLWDRIDKGVRSLLERAKELETEFNARGNIEAEDLQIKLSELNNEWRSLDYLDEPCGITGRLRLVEDIDDNDIMAIILAEVGLQPKAIDAYGEYYPAYGYQTQVIGFCADEIDQGAPGKKIKVNLEVALDDDAADEGSFMVYIEDLEYISVPEPTHAGAEAILWEQFPDLMQHICDALPDDCGNDMQIIRALDDFAVTFGIDAHDTDLTREQMLNYIELYITDRLQFDDSMEYTISVDGTIYGLDNKREVVPRTHRGDMPCRIGHVRLQEQAGTDPQAKIKTYQPILEIFVPLGGRGSPWTMLRVPIESIRNLCNNRPSFDASLFDGETAVYHPDQLNPELELAMLPNRPDADSTTVEVERPQLCSQEILVTINEQFTLLRARALAITAQRFDTKAEALKARDEIDELISEFHSNYPFDRHLVLALSGEGVMFCRPELTIHGDTDQHVIDIKIEQARMQYGDITTHERGRYMGATTSIAEDKDGKHLAYASLIFNALHEPDGVQVQDPTNSFSLFQMTTSRLVMVDLSNPDLEISSVDLQKIEARQRVLAAIERASLDAARKQFLGEHIAAIAEEFDAVDPAVIKDFGAITSLNELAIAVAGDSVQSEIVADALSVVIGTGYSVIISGPSIDADNLIRELDQEGARIIGVISAHPRLRAPEPIFLAEVRTKPDENGITSLDDVRLIPLSTIRAIQH